jgi:hypothetical protein
VRVEVNFRSCSGDRRSGRGARNDAVLQEAARIIGYGGVNGFAFYDAAKKRPCYDKYRFENAVRDLTVFSKREQGRYELTPNARTVCRVLLGCPPEDPDYAAWWTLRLISNPDAVPPVPLEPPERPKKAPRTRARKAKAGG